MNMRKITFLILILFSAIIYAEDIQIYDFETAFPSTWGTNGNPTSNQFNEDHVNFNLSENPDKTGINTSNQVGKFRRLLTGQWWAYAWFEFTPVYVEATVSQPKYVHVSIYKPVVSRVTLQMRNVNGGTVYNTGEIHNDKQTAANVWQELVYKITTSGNIGFIAVKPDFVNATVSSRLSGDIDIYIDNIYINDDPTPLGESSYGTYQGNLPEDFEGEHTLLNPIAYAGDRFGSFIQSFSPTDVTVVDNPLKVGNLSDKCGMFVRKKDGPWNAGFNATPISPVMIDATNKYLHIMVYKTMESSINIKLEAGSPVANSGDIVVVPAASDVNKWTDYVFEIPAAKYSTYSKIAFFLDFMQTPAPSERFSEDQLIYFDDIEINSSPDLRVGGIGTQLTGLNTDNKINAWRDMEGNIRIMSNDEVESVVCLFDVVGKQVQSLWVKPGESVIATDGLRGIYVLKTASQQIKILL
jgi:hypothetical protein